MAGGLKGKIILVVVLALVLACLLLFLVFGGGNTTPNLPDRDETLQTDPSQADTLPAENVQQTEDITQAATDPTETKPTGDMATSPIDPNTDVSEGIEVWEDTQPSTQPTTAPNVPTQPTTPGTQPTTPEPTESQKMTYAQYLALSRSQQQEFVRSFDNVEDFYEWLDAAEAEYKANQPDATGSGSIDIGDYIP